MGRDPTDRSFQRVSETEVLRSAEEDSKEVMVIYAAEDALIVEQSDLPQPLLVSLAQARNFPDSTLSLCIQDFLAKDNASFDEELKEYEKTKRVEFNSNWEDYWTNEQPPAYEGSWAPAEDDAGSKSMRELTTADAEVQMVSSGDDTVVSDSDSIVDVVTVDNMPSPKSDGKAEHVEFADR